MLKIGTPVYLCKERHVKDLVYDYVKDKTPEKIVEPFIVVNRAENYYSLSQDFGGDDINRLAWIKETDLTTDKNAFIELVKNAYCDLQNETDIDE